MIFKVIGQRWRSLDQIFTALHPCEHSRINILQWIFTKLGTYLVLKRIWNPIDFQSQRSRSPGQIFTMYHPCEHSRINILQWILTKLGTYLVLKRIWNPIDFQGQRSRSLGQIFRRGDTPCFALPLLVFVQMLFTCTCTWLFCWSCV